MISFNSYKAAQASSPNLSSTESSPKKYNLSFSLNIDGEQIDSDHSSDSESANLHIDVAEVDDHEQPKKRRRVVEQEMSVINEMEQELERQLDAKAAKTNLTATNVKNILKHVITNEHVLAMVHNRLHNTEDNIIFEPKLTRAKAKELAKSQPNIPWPMTPVKKLPPPEVQALIASELCEDSSDEEYDPSKDQHSEDEESPAVVNVSQTSTVDEESIVNRTRSKLNLNETSLEQIEQSFIPPDITTDMYDWDCDIDEEWDKFLKEFANPLNETNGNDDDPEADPEYNILDDHESEMPDKEELRIDNAVKVTRKELNDLVAELFEFEDMFSKSQPEQPKKKNKSPDNSTNLAPNVGNNRTININSDTTQSEKIISDDHRSLLATQFEQHVQLMAQSFVLSYLHPEFHDQSELCRDNLNSIKILQNGANSAFNVRNLDEAFNLINSWESKFDDKKFYAQYIDNLEQEIHLAKKCFKSRVKYQGDLHPAIKKLFLESKALMYPELLPIIPFRSEIKVTRKGIWTEPEKKLLALGVTEFFPFVESQNRKFRSIKATIERVAFLINEHMMPNRTPSALVGQIWSSRISKTDNPIRRFFRTGEVPPRIHFIASNYLMKAPKDHPITSLPPAWQKYIEREKNRKYDSLESLVSDLSNSTNDILIDNDLLTPTINMMSNANLKEIGKKMSKNAGNYAVSSSSTGTSVEQVANKGGTLSEVTSQQMRKTTPRLAKTRSVQNMKLKSSTGNSSVNKNYVNSNVDANRNNAGDKEETFINSHDSCSSSSKGDNEDEIAELMLASTTIKKDTVNRKKAKQVRESENIKRMLEAEKELGQEERATKFAASFMQKLHLTLESNNPEALRAVIKLYLEYNEKIEKNESDNDEKINNIKEKREKSRENLDQLAINLYKDVCEVLKDYPEMCTDFLLFLKPHQAAMINKLIVHTMLQKMSDFINATQVYFAKQPSRMARVMQAITHLASDPDVTLETVYATMDPVLKGHPLIMDMFQQIIPHGKPPDSLFAASLFENLTCPVLPHDKNRTFSEDAPELYENIELLTPTSQDDPYGGDNCKCDCHEANESQSKTISEHCISCGVRYLNGRVYLQTSEGLRPAKITFPGDDDEKLENIARVSLKANIDKAATLPPPTSRRRKSSKNDANDDNISNQKNSCPLKNSPTKENPDDSEKNPLKGKRGAKSPPKSFDQKKSSKSSDSAMNSNSNTGTSTVELTSPLKSKRDKRAERREAKIESKTQQNVIVDLKSRFAESSVIPNNAEESSKNKNNTTENNNEESSRLTQSDVIELDNIADNTNIDSVNNSTSTIASLPNSSSDNSDKTESIISSSNEKPWTRHEDTLLLQSIQKDYSENTFISISEKLGDRTVQQVKERCQTLLSLMEKMVY